MRNVFDQYNHPENRLSHALAVCLHEDRALLRGLLAWVGVKSPARVQKLTIAEQSLHGDAAETDEEAERKGLPDIGIHDGAAWCLLIESKVQAALTDDQLARHERTLRRRPGWSPSSIASGSARLAATGSRAAHSDRAGPPRAG